MKKPNFRTDLIPALTVICDGEPHGTPDYEKKEYTNRMNYFWRIISPHISQEETDALVKDAHTHAGLIAIYVEAMKELVAINFACGFEKGTPRAKAGIAQKIADLWVVNVMDNHFRTLILKYNPKGANAFYKKYPY